MEKNNHPIVFYFLALRKSKTFYGHNDYVCVCASIRLDHGQKVVTIDGHACRHYPLQKWFMTARRLQQSLASYYRATTEQAGRLTGAKIIFTLRRKGGKECTMG